EAGAAEELQSDPVLQGLDSAQDGRLIVLDDQDLIDAFSSGSAPGVHHALDGIVPELSEALDQGSPPLAGPRRHQARRCSRRRRATRPMSASAPGCALAGTCDSVNAATASA